MRNFHVKPETRLARQRQHAANFQKVVVAGSAEILDMGLHEWQADAAAFHFPVGDAKGTQ